MGKQYKYFEKEARKEAKENDGRADGVRTSVFQKSKGVKAAGTMEVEAIAKSLKEE